MITVIICAIVIAVIGLFSEWRVYKSSLKTIETARKYNELIDKYNALVRTGREVALDFEALYKGMLNIYTEEELEDLIFVYRRDDENNA